MVGRYINYWLKIFISKKPIRYLRTKTRDIAQMGGLGEVMPRLMGFGIILSMAGVGVPLLMGFVGEFLVFLGAFNSSLDSYVPIKFYTIFALIILVLSACYMLRFLHKTFFGNLLEKWKHVNDITIPEFVVLSMLAIAVAFFGVFPMAILDIIQPVLTNILQFLQV